MHLWGEERDGRNLLLLRILLLRVATKGVSELSFERVVFSRVIVLPPVVWLGSGTSQERGPHERLGLDGLDRWREGGAGTKLSDLIPQLLVVALGVAEEL